MTLCNGHTTKGEPCGNDAMIGRSKCRKHGGPNRGRPPTHGRYSKHIPQDIAGRVDELEQDPRILDLRRDIAVAVAWFERFQSTFREGQGISFEQGQEIRQWLDQISKITERAHKIIYGEQYTVTVEGLVVMIARVADVVGLAIDAAMLPKTVSDSLREDIASRLRALTEGK